MTQKTHAKIFVHGELPGSLADFTRPRRMLFWLFPLNKKAFVGTSERAGLSFAEQYEWLTAGPAESTTDICRGSENGKINEPS